MSFTSRGKNILFFTLAVTLITLALSLKLGIFGSRLVWGDISYISADSFGILMDRFLYVWDTASLGTQIRSTISNLQMAASALFRYDWAIQITHFILPVAMGVVSMHVFLDRRIENRWLKYILCLYYVANPVVLVVFLIGQKNVFVFFFGGVCG
jgi:hypothetical protein